MEIYAAMVSDLDSYIGEVIDYLKEIGEYENTFIVFTSDNGTETSRMDLGDSIQPHVGVEYDQSIENLGSASSYVMYGRNWASATQTPLNRHKATGFEGGIRVPAFAHAPGLIAPGTRSNAVLHVMDLLPTFMELAEAPLPQGTYRGREIHPIQGHSFLPLVTGETDTLRSDNEVVGWELHGHRSVRMGDWKIVWDQALPAEERRWQLFNLADDPFEQQDLSESMPEKYQEMVSNWEAYVRDSGVVIQ
jgi:arylsulfatase